MKNHRPDNSPERQRGQAIVLIAFGFILLLGFTGLVVDVARVFVARGNLRRALDSAGLAAAAQFKQNATVSDIQTAAEQFIYAHGIVADTQTFYDMAVVTQTIRIETCDTVPGDPYLCPPNPNTPRRKLVRLKAEADVSMTFLQILKVPTVRIFADSVSEAAAVDVVLMIDASAGQAYDPPSMEAYNGRADLSCDLNSFTTLGIPLQYGAQTNACIKACNDDPAKPCYPFKKVKDAAISFIDQLYSQYDRVAVVRIDREQPASPDDVVFPLGLDLNAAKQAIRDMRVSDSYPQYSSPPGAPCPYATYGGSPTTGQDWKCTTANTGGALIMAGQQFRRAPFRDDSLWTIILLSSSSADATDVGFASIDPDTMVYGFCPGKNVQPLCRDKIWATHHISTSTSYDAEDYAYDKATYLGLAPDKSLPGIPDGGAGILIFTIGLGRKVVCTGAVVSYNPGPPVQCVPTATNPYVDPNTGYPNIAESFLRYVAYIGAVNEIDYANKPDPCQGALLGESCGNYYFAPDADQLQDIFLAIAGKIFTRLSG